MKGHERTSTKNKSTAHHGISKDCTLSRGFKDSVNFTYPVNSTKCNHAKCKWHSLYYKFYNITFII